MASTPQLTYAEKLSLTLTSWLPEGYVVGTERDSYVLAQMYYSAYGTWPNGYIEPKLRERKSGT